jgi:hypothetical protein
VAFLQCPEQASCALAAQALQALLATGFLEPRAAALVLPS